MNNPPLIIGDSDSLISTLHQDVHHEEVKELLRKLSVINAEIYFPAAIVAETITTFQRKMSNPSLAEEVVKRLTSDLIAILPTDKEILQRASTIFKPRGSKQDTFFDAIVAATAKKYEATAILGFDEWYKKQGFTMAGELVESEETM